MHTQRTVPSSLLLATLLSLAPATEAFAGDDNARRASRPLRHLPRARTSRPVTPARSFCTTPLLQASARPFPMDGWPVGPINRRRVNRPPRRLPRARTNSWQCLLGEVARPHASAAAPRVAQFSSVSNSNASSDSSFQPGDA